MKDSGYAAPIFPARILANELALMLVTLGMTAQAEGAGGNWRVRAGSDRRRTVRVECVWHEDWSGGGLRLGMNPANARCRLEARRVRSEGADFEVELCEDDQPVAGGRTAVMAAAAACVATWLSGASTDALVKLWPFVDAERRTLLAFVGQLDPMLPGEILGHVDPQLWVYSRARSCRVHDGACTFFAGGQEVALARTIVDAAQAIDGWLRDGRAIHWLGARGVEIERHAEILEVDPARWHWLHVRDRMADPDDVLAPLAPLLCLLAASPIASCFYTYSSLFFLRFSASSHFPWTGDYPQVAGAHGRYWVGAEECTVDEALARIEATLSASPVQPFFGTQDDYTLPLLTEALRRRGSTHRTEIVRRGPFRALWLTSGTRRCRLLGGPPFWLDVVTERGRRFDTLDDAVEAGLRFLDE